MIVQFTVADPSHDEGIRQLLREQPMAGDVRISLQREPGYFAAAPIGGQETTIVAVDEGRVVCVGSVAIRDRYFNGSVTPVGYLGQLRLAASHAGRMDVLRRGYAFFDSLRPTLGAMAFFTSIALDNARALRLLSRAARGLPRYALAGELVTVLLPTRRFRGGFRRGIAGAAGPTLELLNAANPAFQFAPAWTTDDLNRLPDFGLMPLPWPVLGSRDRPAATAAVWDQRAFKQVIVAGYSARLRRVRWLYNAAARMFRGTLLPPVNSVLKQAFVSHLVAPTDRPDLVRRLLWILAPAARLAGIDVLTLSFDARDPRLAPLVARYRPRLYRTQLFTVTWPGDPDVPPDGRLVYPEAALL